MESSLQLQMKVKNNAQELQNYMLDLNNWEEEMKRKEAQLNKEKFTECDIPPPRNKIKKNESSNSQKLAEKPKKISAYDYSAWDKFDVEKACDEIDNQENSKNKESEQEEAKEAKKESSEDEEEKKSENDKRLELVDEAFYEKEMGNQFVKKEQWDSAIKCYTNAINLDSKNPIFYANRSLCFLKKKNFKAAETDATVAIQLDKNYVKAYQRRAFVRSALGQLLEAKADYEEVLRLEPKNALARVEIDKIDKALSKPEIKPVVKKKTFNHKDLFKNEEKKTKSAEPCKEKPSTSKDLPKSDSVVTVNKVSTPVKVTENKEPVPKKKISSNKGNGDEPSPKIEPKKEENVFKPLPEWCKLIQPVNIPPHKRSKKPLRKIDIVNVYEDVDSYFQEETPPVQQNTTEKKKEKETTVKTVTPSSTIEKEKLSFDIPKTSIQFQNCWKVLKSNSDEAYSYLKKIPGSKLPLIFENSLESDFFSDLVTFLANDEVNVEPEFLYDFLLGLSQVKRFSTLTLFMSNQDQNCIKKCIAKLEKTKSKEEMSHLKKLYEL